MILKHFKPRDSAIAELERLLAVAPPSTRPKIEQELRLVRAGDKGERESAYLIDFECAASKNRVVFHDLRFEVNGRVAQIDHLMINRFLDVYVFETKHFHAGIKITEDGEFLRWNDYRKNFEGMPSPLAQNERHIQVLKDVFRLLDMPSRLGVRLEPAFYSLVLVAPTARIDRPRKYDTSRVIKADALAETLRRDIDELGILSTFGSAARIVSTDTLEDIGRQLLLRHSPVAMDYTARFGLDQPPAVGSAVGTLQQPSGPVPLPQAPKCRACGAERLSIQYGKYGYYFKCSECDGNTPIKLGCGVEGHKERLRKDGQRFYRECAACQTSRLFFENP